MTKAYLKVIILTLCFTFFLSIALDWEAKRVVQQLYPRDTDGVIVGLAGFYYEHHKPNAIIFVHGFLDSPESFKDYFNNAALRQHYDIEVPRLRFHAKNLHSATYFNNEGIEKKLLTDILAVSKLHQHVTIVAQSYGGAVILKQLNQHKPPQNATVILLAPAFFVKGNNLLSNLKLYSYGLWRNYCNYPRLG